MQARLHHQCARHAQRQHRSAAAPPKPQLASGTSNSSQHGAGHRLTQIMHHAMRWAADAQVARQRVCRAVLGAQNSTQAHSLGTVWQGHHSALRALQQTLAATAFMLTREARQWSVRLSRARRTQMC